MVVRFFGFINVVIGCEGIYMLTEELEVFTSGHHGHERYLSQAYYTMTLVNLICLIVMLMGGIYLLCVHHFGLVICNCLFGFQIVYFLLVIFLGSAFLGSSRFLQVGSSIAGATGIGNMGTAIEGGIVYPILALVALNLAYRRLKQQKGSCAAS